MEAKSIWILPLSVYTDEVLGFSYLKYLSSFHFDAIKLPVRISEYKYKHLLNSSNLILIDAIKTKKNWILKEIVETKTLVRMYKYSDYLKFAQLNKLILKYYQEGCDVELLDSIINLFITNKVENLELKAVESELEMSMGFR
ncbi:MAG: hypothetical protein AAGF07_00670 [Patescibacteria group bacterium]